MRIHLQHCLLLIAVGCHQPANASLEPAAQRAAPLAVLPNAASTGGETGARALALAPSHGSDAVDRRLAQLSAQARQHPRQPELWVELGRAWVSKARESSDPGYYSNANACADVALELASGDRAARDLRTLVLLNEHRFAEARALAEAVIGEDPEAAMAWGSLSDAALELGDLERADDAAQRMMELKPNLPSYSRTSYLQWLKGDIKGALESARLALDAGGSSDQREPRAWMLVQAALIFWQRGDYAGADAGFEQALAVQSEYPPALVGRGRVALAQGNAARAAQLFERSYARSPLAETAWLLSEAHERAGDAAGAERARLEAERQGRLSDPRTLSLLYSTRNEQPEAALMYAERESERRGDIYTLDTLAWAQYRNGRLREAKASIERARRFGTLDARLLYHQGAIELGLGQVRRGKRLIAQALALNPHFDERGAAEAARLLGGA